MNAKSKPIHAATCALDTLGDTLGHTLGITLRMALGMTLAMILGAVLVLATDARAAQDDAQNKAQEAPDATPPEIAAGRTEQIPVPAEDRGQNGPPRVDVRQRQEFGQTITEYERAGRVFLMTVKPRVGPTQYWNDPDGDGQFQRSTSDNIDESVNLPKWRLGSW